MSGRTYSRIIAAAVALLLSAVCADAQTYGGYAPYSIFGVGDLSAPGTAYNKSMGGVGIAGRTHRFINPINPASITARDSLSFMADFSVYSDNKIFTQGDMKNTGNTANIGDLIISFPIWKRDAAMMIGVSPYSNTGFGYSYTYDNPGLIGKTGYINYSASGMGAMYQAYAAAAVTLFKRISLGAQFNYYFGQTEKKYYETFTDKSYNGAQGGYELQLSGVGGKFGVQYEQPIGTKSTLTVGATYQLSSKVKGFVEGYRYSTGTAAADTLYHKIDTLANTPGKVKLASEIGIGINYNYADKFMVELDYTRSDWTGSGLDTTPGFTGNINPGSNVSVFKTTISESYRFGLEYVPNRSDIRYYFKKVAYRAGAYYKKDYYLLDGQGINSMGITLGATLPIYKWYNGLTVGIDFGQRGSVANNLIRERYINFSIGVNIFDIWFQKYQYD